MDLINLVLVDDHQVVRTSLKTFLESIQGFHVIGEAEDGESAIRVVQEKKPEVVIMDITMPGMDGLEASRRLRTTCPESKILALTIHDNKQYFFEMLSAGATGYLTKQAAAEELVEAIRVVASGFVYLQPALARWLLDDYQRLLADNHTQNVKEEDLKQLDVLSKRERQVLELVADGLNSPQIAMTLGISPKTVSRHRERIMNKLDLHNRAELVRFAVRTGLIDA